MTMTAEHWQRLRAVFDAVAELPPEAWADAVAERAGDDAELRREVLELLRAQTGAGPDLDRPALLPELDPGETEPAGIRLGNYRLLREVGQGGMGSVYEAVRDDQQFQKRVAIKLVRRGMASESLLRRFRQERQILAGLDHPNIARLLDGGLMTDGRPYLVMEFVEGETITQFCQARQLPVRERLRLFLAVCDAVAYAHGQLIVHRDLKPGNILVTGDGVVKLLDFGVAKLLPDPTLEGRDQPTVTMLRPFTPGYASPEQLRGDPVSTSTDVYSLGVILYELLAGRHPFDAGNRSPMELVQLADTEPSRPSETVTDELAATSGEGTAARLRRLLSGELDNICLMAMRKESSRRYSSVEQLAEDVRRYQDGLPVLAQRDSVGYRWRKFVGRHRAGVAAALLVLLSLAGGLAATAWQARRARLERDRARVEARKAQQINVFLSDMLRSADPSVQGAEVRVVDLLAAAAARARGELASEPEVLAAVQTAIGQSYAGLGLFAEAESLMTGGLKTLRGLPGLPPRDVATAQNNYARLLLDEGKLDEAERQIRGALSSFRPAAREDSIVYADLHGTLGSIMRARGDLGGAAGEMTAVLALRRRLLGPDDAAVAVSLNDLAVVRSDQGDFEQAAALHREALARARRAGGPNHPELGAALYNLAFDLTELKRLHEADSLFRASLDLRLRVLGAGHPDIAWTRYGYASVLHDEGKFAAAAEQARLVVAMRGRALPTTHPILPAAMQVLGISLMAEGRPAEALPHLRESLALRSQALPPGHWLIATSESVLGECLTQLGRYDEAEPLLVRSLARLRQVKGAENPRTIEAAARLEKLKHLRA